MKLIYIFGRGHSGSTILDLCVSRAFCGFSGGEIISGLRRDKHLDKCACGSYLCDCEIWGAVHSKLEDRGFVVKDFILQNYKFVNFFKFMKDRSRVEEFDQILVSELSKKIQNRVAIDSSKELYRAYCLAKNKQLDVELIFITRNGLSVLSSYRSRLYKNGTINFMRKKRKIPKIMLYFMSNLGLPILIFGGQSFAVGVYFFLKFTTNRKIKHINYDKLPNIITDDDFRVLKEELAFEVGPSHTHPIYHPISGNQIIWSKNFEVSFKPKRAIEQKLRLCDRILYAVIALPHIFLRVVS